MTRLPLDAFKIEPLRGPEYPDYKVASICAVDGCSRYTDHAHHIVRRSFTIGPYSWVRLGDQVIGNLMPLCFRHHEQVTRNETRIVWDEGSRLFMWKDSDGAYIKLAQPPTLEAVVSPSEATPAHEHPESGLCPTCHRRLPVRFEGPREKTRPRKSWVVLVPDDHENGAEMLDVLLESSRLVLDEHGWTYGEGRKQRYQVLSHALAMFVAHGGLLLSDGEGGDEHSSADDHVKPSTEPELGHTGSGSSTRKEARHA